MLLSSRSALLLGTSALFSVWGNAVAAGPGGKDQAANADATVVFVTNDVVDQAYSVSIGGVAALQASTYVEAVVTSAATPATEVTASVNSKAAYNIGAAGSNVDAYGIYTYAGYNSGSTPGASNASVAQEGDITLLHSGVGSTSNEALAILSQAGGGAASIDYTGDIAVTSNNSSAGGLVAVAVANSASGGSASVESAGDISVTAQTTDANLTGIVAQTNITGTSSAAGGTATVTHDGDITLNGAGGAGIGIQAVGGDTAAITSNGNVTLNVSGGLGLVASGKNGATIDHTGDIDNNATVAGSFFLIDPTADSALGLSSSPSPSAAFAVTDAGVASVKVNGNVSQDIAGSPAVAAISNSGSATTNTNGSITSVGSGVVATGSTGATVINSGNITTSGVSASGINAYVGGAGDISVTNSGEVKTSGATSNAVNLTISDGNIVASNTGTVSTAADDVISVAMKATNGTITLNGGATAADAGAITATGANTVAIYALAPGDIMIGNSAAKEFMNVSSTGDGGDGIRASSGTGKIDVGLEGDITTGAAGGAVQSLAVELITDGTSTFTQVGDLSASGAISVSALVVSGTSAAEIDTEGEVTQTGAAGGAGLVALGSTGATVTHVGDINTTAPAGVNFSLSLPIAEIDVTNLAHAAVAGADTGDAVATVTGNVTTAFVSDDAAVAAGSDSGNATATLTGSVNASAAAGVGTAVGTTGTATSVAHLTGDSAVNTFLAISDSYEGKAVTTATVADGVTATSGATAFAALGNEVDVSLTNDGTITATDVLAATATTSGTVALNNNANAAMTGDVTTTNTVDTVVLAAGSTFTGTMDLQEQDDKIDASIAALPSVLLDGGDGADTLTFTDSGTIDVTKFTEIETVTAFTGVDTVAIGSTTDFTTLDLNDGDDVVSLDASGAVNGVVKMGAGDDEFTVNGGTLTGSVDGGTGGDDTYIVGTGTADFTTFTNFETVQLTDSVDTLAVSAVPSTLPSELATIDFGDDADVLTVDTALPTGLAFAMGLGDDTVHTAIANMATVVTGDGGDDTLHFTDSGTLDPAKFSDFEAVNAFTGDDTADISTATVFTSFDLGDGADTVSLSAGGSVSGAIDMGAGSDSFTANGGTSTGTIDGGVGDSDVFVQAGATPVFGFTNFETMQFTANADSFSTSNLPAVLPAELATVDFLDGADTLTVDAAAPAALTFVMGDGDDTVNSKIADLPANITGDAGTDTLSFTDSGTLTPADFSDFEVVNAFSGDDTADISTTAGFATFDLGAGNDSVSLSASGAVSGVVKMGAGDDEFTADGGNLTGSVDGGTGGDDTYVVGTGTADFTTFTNFETVQLTDSVDTLAVSAVPSTLPSELATIDFGDDADVLTVDTALPTGLAFAMGLGDDTVNTTIANIPTSLTDAGGTDSVNFTDSGTLTLPVFADFEAINAFSGDDVFTLPTGTTFAPDLNMGAGDDVVNAAIGGYSGALDGGAHTTAGDLVNLSGTGAVALTDFTNFEDIALTAGTAADLSGSTTASLAIASGATGTAAAAVAVSDLVVDGTLDLGTTGAVTASGDFTLGTGATLASSFAAGGGNGTVAVTGTATFDTGSAIALAGVGDALTDGTSYTIVTAGTLTDNGAALTDSIAFWGLEADANAAANTFAVIATKELELQQLDEGGSNTEQLASVIDDIAATPGSNSADASQFLADLEAALAANPGQEGEVIADLVGNDGAGATFAALSSSNQAMVSVETRLQSLNAFGDGQFGRQALFGRGAGQSLDEQGAIWLQPFVAMGSQDKVGSVDGYEFDGKGVAFGADFLANANTRVGFAYALSGSEVSATGNSAGDTTDIMSNQFIGYVRSSGNRAYGEVILGAAAQDYDRVRVVNALNQTLTAEFDGSQFSARATAGLYQPLSNDLMLRPEIQVQYSRLNIDGYSESGGNAALTVQGVQKDILTGSVGGYVAARIEQNNLTLVPEFGAFLVGESGDSATTTAQFNVGGASFNSEGLERASTGIRLRPMVTGYLADDMTIKVTYDGEFREGSQSHIGALNLRWHF